MNAIALSTVGRTGTNACGDCVRPQLNEAVIIETRSPHFYKWWEQVTEVIDLSEAPVTLRHSVRKWLSDNEPHQKSFCFVHGDFHYANVLWHENEIKMVLDWELSGFGWREFDIAWAIILRPSQRFLKTEQEINIFLEGYGELSDYTYQHVIYAMVLIYQHFHLIAVNCKDTEYKAYVEKEMVRLMSVKPVT